MKWPWVSRAAFDLLMDERDRLRLGFDACQDHVQRITRKQEGMTETPREPKKSADPIPLELERIIMRFGNEQNRTDMRNHARIAHHRDGAAWSEIQAELEKSLA